MITKGGNPDQRICVVDGGDAIIEHTHSCSEVYLVPDIVTNLSAGSTSSSVFAETGAPIIRHDAATSSASTTDTDDEEEQSPLNQDQAIDSTVQHEDYRCPHYLQSTLKHDRNGCEIILNSVNRYLEPPRKDDGNDSDRSDDDDIPYFISSTMDKEHAPHNGSMGASSITLSDAFSIDQRMFDFSQRLMPEMTPRRSQRTEVLCNKQQRNLSIIATTPSRYQRPVDSLLISHKHPSPIYTNAIWRKQEHEHEQLSIDRFGYENINPQSPSLTCRQLVDNYLGHNNNFAGSKQTTFPRNELKIRCANNNIHPLSPRN